ncbi:ATP-dependent nuclease [Pseudomonas aeruginosa]|uniref:ATP-dependent nuclease n=3 Tax=Pseudomonas aeruginosa TaxID=287 RepID=UPI00234A121B|nr:ATP-dependent endonuclease [Pseudomonas aeruginosa]
MDMHIESLRIRNFRRLRDVKIDLAREISIFVGANNSGKTSASHALQLFTAASKDRFSIHDFSVACWEGINAFGERADGATLPTISLDIWFHVNEVDLHRVVDLLPSLDWEGSLVGLRVEFAAKDPEALVAGFQEAREQARAGAGEGRAQGYEPVPRTLRDYLEDNLNREFELRYYVLDHTQFDADLQPTPDYEPQLLTPDKGRTGRDILGSLLRVDVLHAQRHLSDSAGGSRAEDLSRCLSRFYERNLEKRGHDHSAIQALSNSEALLNDHLSRVFEPTLARLSDLGYPGVANPRLLIKTALNPITIMSSHDARVHYALGEPREGVDPPTLPDQYNGLGFKNLIYMVVEILDLHARWMDIEENRPPLHLVFIEEPEAHLHAQLQQVFIRKIQDILEIDEENRPFHATQLVVTTHSSHILYEHGFQPIRYFRRVSAPEGQSSEVLSLSKFYQNTENSTRDFLERYLRLTHCDLFFADAAVLVEGNVERLLLPGMIRQVAPRLQSTYLSVLEIGGAFGHRFKTLIEFLGITALIITDIDSIRGPNNEAAIDQVDAEAVDDEDDDDPERTGTACPVHTEGATTSNQTLRQWLPRRTSIAELLEATPEQRTQPRANAGDALVRVTYQTRVMAQWRDETNVIAGRTLEEAFALQNLRHCQHIDNADLKLRVRGADNLSLEQIAERLHNKIKSSNFKKTDFALALLGKDPATWQVPSYIAEGLGWLEEEVAPPPPAPANAGAMP